MSDLVSITREQADDILDILNGVVEENTCFATLLTTIGDDLEGIGEKNCLHCKADKAVEHLLTSIQGSGSE